jgi:hypothetical protein
VGEGWHTLVFPSVFVRPQRGKAKEMQQQPEVKLCDAAEQVVEKLLSYCASCLKDLWPDYKSVECNGCQELLCYEYHPHGGCLCDRRKKKA